MRVAFCPGAKNPFFDQVLLGASARLAEEKDVRLVSWMGNESVPPAALPILKVDGFLAGALMLETEGSGLSRVPRVGFSHYRETLPWDRVVNDDYEVGRTAAAGLADAGYETLACLGGVGPWHMSRREAGVRDVAISRGLPYVFQDGACPPPRPGERFPDVYVRHEKNLTDFLGALPPNSGLVCLTEGDAKRVRDHLLALGRPWRPDELGLILADLPGANSPADTFAHVALDGERVGRQAMQDLLDILAGRRVAGHTLLRIPPRGIVGGASLRGLSGLLPRVQAYCLQHLGEKILVEDIARHVGMSRRSMEMKLREQGLPSPHAILLRLRLDAAKERLAGGGESIEFVAEACGFGEARALARHFRQRFGTTPRQFRLAARRPAP